MYLGRPEVADASARCSSMGDLRSSRGETSVEEEVSAAPAETPAGSPGSSPPVSQPISLAMPQWGQVTRNGWWLLGGVVLVFIGSLLPWVEVSAGGVVAVSSHPGGGGVVIFLFLAICTVLAGRPLLIGGLSKRRLLGTTAVVAILTLLAVTNWSDLHNVQQQAVGGLTGGFVTVSAGSGLVLYTVGVVVLCVLVVRLWLFRRHRAPAAT